MAANPSVRIVTDTTATLPTEYVASHPIEVVPQIVNFGEESFLEEVNLSYAEFIRRLKGSPQLPRTAAPPPGELVRAYARQLEHAQTVISIHPSCEISGTVRSAWTAKETSFPQADIRVIDTRAVGANLAAMVMVAVDWAEDGLHADEIVQRVQAMIPRGRMYFVLSTLEYLQKGGRIGGAAALLGSALQIKPILELRNGRVQLLQKVRTRRLALERLRQLTIEQCPRTMGAHLAIMHAGDAETARMLVRDLQAALGIAHIPVFSVGAAITTHAGPGAVGVGFFT
jgi:DegV family protein with EDD domain